MNWYNYSKSQLETELNTSSEAGLAHSDVKARLIKYGPNVLPEKPVDGWVKVFVRQFKSPLIYILVVCAVTIFYLGEVTDAGIILAVIFINAVIGTFQEGKAGKIMQSLKRLSSAEATVLRGGTETIIPEAEIVPGDILILDEGQKVTADARVIFSHNLSLDEAPLTGESGAVAKGDHVLTDANLPASSQHNMVFKGTAVLAGSGKAIVVGTGLQTEIGNISRALLMPEEEIPLQKNIRLLSRVIIIAIVILSSLLFILGTSLGRTPREMFSLVVSLSVSIIPEGLPLVLTVILASGVWHMSKRNALVKKMQAVEALGQAKIIAVDKTGTLTENQMIVKQLFLGKNIYTVTGNGYKPQGQVLFQNHPAPKSGDLELAARIGSLAGRANVVMQEATGLYKVSGDPTEAAMEVFGEKLGQGRQELLTQYNEVGEIPFDHKNKYRAVFYSHQEKIFCAVAGAPEVIIKKSTHYLHNGQAHQITPVDRALFEEAVEEFTQKGFRVVAFGYKHESKSVVLDDIDGLVFGGLFGIEDALRPEARSSIAQAEEAGVKVVMITGDHKSTARAIAREAGIYSEGDLVVTGPEMAEMSAEQLAEKLSKVSVFARVTPDDKMKIIQAYKHAGLITAMTGDGVNDAPSLVAADLGVAMGKIGTEVAKEAADIVLLDDNLSSIVAAIRQGRVMYQNIKKALQFLFATSLGELFTIVAAIVLKMPLPVTAVQILWLNLVTDPLIGAALAMEKAEEDVGHKPKHALSKYFIDGPMLVHMAMVGVIMAAGAITLFNFYLPVSAAKANSMALTLLAVFQWYNGLNCRFLKGTIFTRQIWSNGYLWLSLGVNLVMQILALNLPIFQKILKTTPLNLAEWLTVLVLGLAIVFADELRKYIYRLFTSRSLPTDKGLSNVSPKAAASMNIPPISNM